MILKGNARGGARDLALHLLKEENEHVELYELRGFVSETLPGALNEAYAVSKGTRCKQFLYSLSMNPPPDEKVPTETFLNAAERIEERLGLTDQPRAIVFHEKEGRRHAHIVWSRIDADEMKAIQLSFDHDKLMGVSRELYLEHGWRMPDGLARSENRDPRNFTLEEWQQAKRIGKDPRAIKTAIQDAWAISDSKAAFSHALEERGYVLARGDRRGYVAVDVHGEVFAIPRMTGIKMKEVRARLGEAQDLPGLDEANDKIAKGMIPALERFKRDIAARDETTRKRDAEKRRHLVERQQREREALRQQQEQRRILEAQERQARFRSGLGGLWDRLRGEHKRIRDLNEADAIRATERDRKERDQQIFGQLDERKIRRAHSMENRLAALRDRAEIESDLDRFRALRSQRSRDGPEPER